MGANIETTDGQAPLRSGRQALRRSVPTACRQRAGQVGGPPRRPAPQTAGRRASSSPQPSRDHTENLLAQAGVRVTRKPRSVSVAPGGAARAGRDRDPGRLLVGGAVHRRGNAARRLGADDPRRQPESAPHRPARSCSSGWARTSPSSTGGGSAASRQATSTSARPSSSATTIGAAEVPLLVDELPLFALLAVHAHGDSALRGAAELRAKETDRIEAVVDGLRSLGGAHPRHAPTASPSAASRRGSAAAARSTRAATTGSRCSVRSPGWSRAKGVEVEGAAAAAVSFPGFFDLLDSLRATTS